MLSAYLEEQNSLFRLMQVFHEYIIDEYIELCETKYSGTNASAPTPREIVGAVHQNIYKEIASGLIRKIEEDRSDFSFTKPVKEIYSQLFDQTFHMETNEESFFMENICREVEKYFSLYQFFYRNDEGVLVHIPVTEVW